MAFQMTRLQQLLATAMNRAWENILRWTWMTLQRIAGFSSSLTHQVFHSHSFHRTRHQYVHLHGPLPAMSSITALCSLVKLRLAVHPLSSLKTIAGNNLMCYLTLMMIQTKCAPIPTVRTVYVHVKVCIEYGRTIMISLNCVCRLKFCIV